MAINYETGEITLNTKQDTKYWDESIETMPREELEVFQLEQLKKTLVLAYENAPYYKRSFDEAGVNPYELNCLEDFSEFPFVDKKTERDTQHVGSFLGEMAAVDEEEAVYLSASSGSTGVPTISPFTKQDFDEFQEVESRLFYAAGMRKKDRYAHSLNFTLYVGGPDVIGAQNLGALCLWVGTVPSDKLLTILKDYQISIIWTTPSYAWYLGETAKKQGIDPAKDLAVRKIIVAGEAGGSIEATRGAIEELWNADLYDFYGISDIFGACSGMCEVKDGLHVAEDQILIEVINPETGEILSDGERGEIVMTSLRKKARPMVRFRTGDIGYITKEKCECGRTHARMYVVGRLDDMMIVSGVNVFPSDVEYVIRNLDGVTGEYRIRIFDKNYTTKYAVELEQSSDNHEPREELEQRAEKALKNKLGVRPDEIIIHDDGVLPRATHKAKRVIDEREQEIE